MSPPSWVMFGAATFDMLGYLPMMLDLEDPAPASWQFDQHYKHGGGWRPFGENQWQRNGPALKFPGDPWLKPLAVCLFRDELIYFYPHELVLIEAPDGSFEVARMD